jgi:hypothetical protein
MAVPSGVLAGGAVSAAALAGIVGEVAASLPLPDAVATASATATRRIIRVAAPRVTSLADIAAIGASLVSTVQAIARAAEPRDAATLLYVAGARASVTFPRSASPALTRDYGLARALAAGVETACLGEAFLAEARTEFPDRRAATEARDRIGSSLDAAVDRIAATLGQAVVAVIMRVARETSGHLVRMSADLQPVVRVDAQRSAPSTALAWHLYGDPQRAGELVDRNRCGTPLFMPASIEAVAPNA